MKQIEILLVILIITFNSYSQTWQNIVPNYSFENVKPNYPCCGNYYSGPPYAKTEEYWNEVYEWTHLLRRQPLCTGNPAVGTAQVLRDLLDHYARSGINRGNGGAGEFLVVPLAYGGLKKSKKYFIEFFRNSPNSSNVYFSNGQPRQCDGVHIIPPSHGIIVEAVSAITGSGWTRTKAYYSPSIDLDWMTLGINGDAGDGLGGGDWDDVRIYEVQENGCRDNWYFDNTEFNYSTEFFQAGQNIYVGTGVDPENGGNHIAGKVYIRSNSYVVLQAGQSVVINDLVMDPGSSKLLIENTPCGANLCPNELSFPSQQLLCNINSKQIGASNSSGWGTQVTWSPSTYLDNANIPNPTFTAPSTGAGTIEYTVSVTYTCDAGFEYTSSQNVTVQYTHSSDPTATISASNINSSTYNYSADFNVSPGVTEINILTIGSPFSDPPYNETFYVGQDFSNGIFNWTLGGNWSSCQNQDIQITTKNICSGASQSLTLNWTKTGSLSVGDIPNVLTLNNDGMNDEFCFSVDHADQYELIVTDRDGLDICDLSGNITSNPACIWDGYDYYHTQYVSTDTYSYILKLYNECAESIQEHGFIDIFNSLPGMALNSNETDNQNPYNVLLNSQDRDANRSNSFSNSNNSPTNNSSEEWYSIVPNPTNGFFKIIGTTKYITKIQIYDISGVFLFEEQDDLSLDISKYASGMYFVHIQTNTGIKILKVERK